MAAWSPSDLTNPSFVATNLSDKDRSYALYSVNSELPGAESRLAAQEAAWNAAQEAANNKPARGDINALKAKAADATLSQAERDAAGTQAAALQEQRDKLSEAEYQAMVKYQNTKDYVDTLRQGQSNLLAAGTVPPGVNMFAAPPGYEERNSPAAQVPDSQNPSPTPAAPSEQLQSAEPKPVSGPTGTPYDDDGNLNLGWGLDENNNPVWIGGAYNDTTGEGAPVSEPPTVANGPTSDPYDELGNLNPGWGLDENNNPVWVKAGYLDATGENISDQKTIPNNSIQGPPYDDEGNLMPGWTLDEENNPVWVGGDFVEPATKASADQSRADFQAEQNARAKGAQKEAQSKATKEDSASFQKAKDWRVRLSLAPSANYLYKVSKEEAGILQPLQATNGVIFPYTPNISVSYAASYDPTELTHSNYKVFQYKNSSVDTVSITGDFTAQDSTEASYLLAVIHFFRSVTKMFYGQDQNPNNGVPPPLVYLSGFGAYQFDNHPMAITNFTYATPTDVDYIRAGSQTNMPGQNVSQQSTPVNTNASGSVLSRLLGSNLTNKSPKFQAQNTLINSDATYVPTKVSISITAIPVVSRNDISNRFSLKEYATGKLLQGSRNKAGGIW